MRRHYLQIAQNQHCNQRRPDLRLYSIRTGTKKGFDFQVLLDCLKKEFNLPAIFINGSDG